LGAILDRVAGWTPARPEGAPHRGTLHRVGAHELWRRDDRPALPSLCGGCLAGGASGIRVAADDVGRRGNTWRAGGGEARESWATNASPGLVLDHRRGDDPCTVQRSRAASRP